MEALLQKAHVHLASRPIDYKKVCDDLVDVATHVSKESNTADTALCFKRRLPQALMLLLEAADEAEPLQTHALCMCAAAVLNNLVEMGSEEDAKGLALDIFLSAKTIKTLITHCILGWPLPPQDPNDSKPSTVGTTKCRMETRSPLTVSILLIASVMDRITWQGLELPGAADSLAELHRLAQPGLYRLMLQSISEGLKHPQSDAPFWVLALSAYKNAEALQLLADKDMFASLRKTFEHVCRAIGLMTPPKKQAHVACCFASGLLTLQRGFIPDEAPLPSPNVAALLLSTALAMHDLGARTAPVFLIVGACCRGLASVARLGEVHVDALVAPAAAPLLRAAASHVLGTTDALSIARRALLAAAADPFEEEAVALLGDPRWATAALDASKRNARQRVEAGRLAVDLARRAPTLYKIVPGLLAALEASVSAGWELLHVRCGLLEVLLDGGAYHLHAHSIQAQDVLTRLQMRSQDPHLVSQDVQGCLKASLEGGVDLSGKAFSTYLDGTWRTGDAAAELQAKWRQPRGIVDAESWRGRHAWIVAWLCRLLPEAGCVATLP